MIVSRKVIIVLPSKVMHSNVMVSGGCSGDLGYIDIHKLHPKFDIIYDNFDQIRSSEKDLICSGLPGRTIEHTQRGLGTSLWALHSSV